jgi:ubiquinone/menaquinone biosynthesis C-methylase UbiE
MTERTNSNPDYGNWVSNRLLYGSAILGVIFLVFSFLIKILIILAVFFFVAFVYFLYARLQFSPRSGNLQNRIRDMVSDYLEWDGRGEALDIGCGNGPLVIALAKKYPQSRIVGIDYWGGDWDYSKARCEENARLEGVSDQVDFQKASASSLPFDDGHFDAVVSNFVFHEVHDTKDKRALVKEALRVLKKGGVFSFQDLFPIKIYYGETEDLLETIKSWGVERVEYVKTNELDFIPSALKLPFMVGQIGLIHGRK